MLDDSIKKIKEDTEKLSQRETKIVETLGIFFGLFAFISVSVQIYTRVTNLFSASIFTFLIFCLLTVIIVIFDILIRDKYKKESLVFGLSLIIILLGLSAIGIFTLKNVSLLPVENSKEFDRAVDLRLNDNYYNKNIVNKLINDNLKKILEQQKVVTQ